MKAAQNSEMEQMVLLGMDGFTILAKQRGRWSKCLSLTRGSPVKTGRPFSAFAGKGKTGKCLRFSFSGKTRGCMRMRKM
ncbi:hypothetical protein B4099_0685 [Heyndrickxia coagulans]|jgi:hypothetical protein|uniref:Uncharacterized protein n=1 Tax=Heyndrickxia coagulans TaxID=1398 RepID=A0A150KIG1_HEYCO|nr:hypothetical protein B4099_0685 [Heyndrickxia coagulans]